MEQPLKRNTKEYYRYEELDQLEDQVFPKDVIQIIRDKWNCVVHIQTSTTEGTGFLIKKIAKKNLVLTTHHVISDEENMENIIVTIVVKQDNKEIIVKAKVVDIFFGSKETSKENPEANENQLDFVALQIDCELDLPFLWMEETARRNIIYMKPFFVSFLPVLFMIGFSGEHKCLSYCILDIPLQSKSEFIQKYNIPSKKGSSGSPVSCFFPNRNDFNSQSRPINPLDVLFIHYQSGYGILSTKIMDVVRDQVTKKITFKSGMRQPIVNKEVKLKLESSINKNPNQEHSVLIQPNNILSMSLEISKEIIPKIKEEVSKETVLIRHEEDLRRELYIKDILEEWERRELLPSKRFEKYLSRIPNDQLFHDFPNRWVDRFLHLEYIRLEKERNEGLEAFFSALGVTEEKLYSILQGQSSHIINMLRYVECRSCPANIDEDWKQIEKIIKNDPTFLSGKSIYSRIDKSKLICPNFTFFSSLNNETESKEEELSKSENGYLHFYHTTTIHSALAISAYGINLNKGGENMDFSDSNGFYLNTDFQNALDWCRKTKGADEEKTKQSAILVFILKQEVYGLLEKKACVFEEANKDWKNCIRIHRTNGMLNEKKGWKNKNYSFISGPQCVNPNPNWIQLTDPPEPKTHNPIKWQLCIRSDDCAEIFFQNLARIHILVDKDHDDGDNRNGKDDKKKIVIKKQNVPILTNENSFPLLEQEVNSQENEIQSQPNIVIKTSAWSQKPNLQIVQNNNPKKEEKKINENSNDGFRYKKNKSEKKINKKKESEEGTKESESYEYNNYQAQNQRSTNQISSNNNNNNYNFGRKK